MAESSHNEMTDPVLEPETAPSKQDFDSLLQMVLAINDALRIHDDHVEFTGSMNFAQDFRELVNGMWHKACRMDEMSKSETTEWVAGITSNSSDRREGIIFRKVGFPLLRLEASWPRGAPPSQIAVKLRDLANRLENED